MPSRINDEIYTINAHQNSDQNLQKLLLNNFLFLLMLLLILFINRLSVFRIGHLLPQFVYKSQPMALQHCVSQACLFTLFIQGKWHALRMGLLTLVLFESAEVRRFIYDFTFIYFVKFPIVNYVLIVVVREDCGFSLYDAQFCRLMLRLSSLRLGEASFQLVYFLDELFFFHCIQVIILMQFSLDFILLVLQSIIGLLQLVYPPLSFEQYLIERMDDALVTFQDDVFFLDDLQLRLKPFFQLLQVVYQGLFVVFVLCLFLVQLLLIGLVVRGQLHYLFEESLDRLIDDFLYLKAVTLHSFDALLRKQCAHTRLEVLQDISHAYLAIYHIHRFYLAGRQLSTRNGDILARRDIVHSLLALLEVSRVEKFLDRTGR